MDKTFQKFILIEGSASNIGVLARTYIHVAFNILRLM